MNHIQPAGGAEIAIAGDGQRWRRQTAEQFAAYLEHRGLKLTHQRHAILAQLLDLKVHTSADELFAALKRKDPTIGRATIFRTLNLLERAGIVGRVLKADGKPHFEVKHLRPHHDHAICVECGAIQEIRHDKIERYQNEAAAKIGFAPLWHRHEVFGRCRRCARKA